MFAPHLGENFTPCPPPSQGKKSNLHNFFTKILKYRSPTFCYHSPTYPAQSAFSGILSVVEMEYIKTAQHAGYNVGMLGFTVRPLVLWNVARDYLKNRTNVRFSTMERTNVRLNRTWPRLRRRPIRPFSIERGLYAPDCEKSRYTLPIHSSGLTGVLFYDIIILIIFFLYIK